MRSQNIFGTPKRCCNRKCKQPFYRESHLGFLPESESEVRAIMRCSKCGDTFAILQMVVMAHDYYETLPVDPRYIKKKFNNPISVTEHRQIKKRMDNENVLKSLYEGQRPGIPFREE